MKQEYAPVMQSEKAINYLRFYVQNGLDRFGIRYSNTMTIDELAERFSRQSLSVKKFLQVVRAEEAEQAFKRKLEKLDEAMRSPKD